ncbi:Protein tyrosine kinase [Quadrisphaera granulorum]|uniref:Protein tyrosine kinase n=2 Tax=Quadrisphaera granulorum TaxID=317664 RepID=A0A315ZW39_9ACTN|nr:protein tyrosine kinase [Quadrisphaera granulorum]SZE98059.1 Protein tyrosine kinase [Quadrisphaera granulorum]
MPSAPQVPGLLVGGPVASPVPGRPAAWWAVDEDGQDVVVQRVRPAGGTGPLAGLDEATLRRSLPHPHVVPLLRVARGREGAVQVLGPVTGICLADLLAERGRLEPGEVTTLVAGVGSALAALHERGLVHGEVCAAGVLVGDGGLPVLLGWGAARAAATTGLRRRDLRSGSSRPRPRPSAPRTTDDVRALALLGLQALGRSSSDLAGLLSAAAEAAADADSGSASPTAEELARACWQAVPPAPLGAGCAHPADGSRSTVQAADSAVTQRIRRTAAVAAATSPEPAAGSRRLRSRVARHPLRWAGGLLAVALLTGGGAALGAARAPDPRLTGDDPAAAVEVLAELRLQAVTQHDTALLAAVDVTDSPAARADADLLASLEASSVEGATSQVLSAQVREHHGDEAWVQVVTEVSAHRVVTGDHVEEVPATGPVTSRLLLRRDGGRWKVAETA